MRSRHSRTSSPSTSLPPTRARSRNTRPRSTPIAARRQPPDFDNTIAALELSGRALARVEQVFGLLVGADSDDALLADRARDCRRRSPATGTNSAPMPALFRRIDALMRQSDDARPDRRAEARARALPHVFPPGRRRARRRGEAAAGRDRRAAGGARHHVQPECARRRASLRARRLHDEAELAGLPEFMRDAMKSDAAGARPRRLRRHAVAFERRAVPAILASAATCAKKSTAPSSPAATMAARPTTRRIIAEMVRLRAERARLLGYPDFAHYRLDDAMAKTPDGRARPARHGVDARRGRGREPTATPCRRWCKKRAATSRSRRGTGATTPRSCASERCDIDEAAIKPYLSLAADDRGRVLHRGAPVRTALHERADVPVWHPGRARLGSARRRRRRDRAVLRRLFCAPVQAQRRLDDLAARPGEARRRQSAR